MRINLRLKTVDTRLAPSMKHWYHRLY